MQFTCWSPQSGYPERDRRKAISASTAGEAAGFYMFANVNHREYNQATIYVQHDDQPGRVDEFTSTFRYT